MGKTKIEPDVRDLIMAKMTGEGRMMSWLSEMTDIPYDTLYSCLKKKSFMLSDDNLNKINEALETDFKN